MQQDSDRIMYTSTNFEDTDLLSYKEQWIWSIGPIPGLLKTPLQFYLGMV